MNAEKWPLKSAVCTHVYRIQDSGKAIHPNGHQKMSSPTCHQCTMAPFYRSALKVLDTSWDSFPRFQNFLRASPSFPSALVNDLRVTALQTGVLSECCMWRMIVLLPPFRILLLVQSCVSVAHLMRQRSGCKTASLLQAHRAGAQDQCHRGCVSALQHSAGTRSISCHLDHGALTTSLGVWAWSMASSDTWVFLLSGHALSRSSPCNLTRSSSETTHHCCASR